MNDPNPIQHFHQLFCNIKDHHPEIEVNAMSLTTVETDGFPKTRMVLLKQYNWEGFIFYTQYSSSKGKAIAKNNKVCLSFLWETANQRITIIGIADKVSQAQPEAYFGAHPRGSQLSAWASQQSEYIASRKILEESYENYDILYKDVPVPKPERWGGYLVRPIEFIFEEIERDIVSQAIYKIDNRIDWQKTFFTSMNL